MHSKFTQPQREPGSRDEDAGAGREQKNLRVNGWRIKSKGIKDKGRGKNWLKKLIEEQDTPERAAV